jgi:hypothetical protein
MVEGEWRDGSALNHYSVFDFDVVQAFRPARHGGPKGPHYAKIKNAIAISP